MFPVIAVAPPTVFIPSTRLIDPNSTAFENFPLELTHIVLDLAVTTIQSPKFRQAERMRQRRLNKDWKLKKKLVPEFWIGSFASLRGVTAEIKREKGVLKSVHSLIIHAFRHDYEYNIASLILKFKQVNSLILKNLAQFSECTVLYDTSEIMLSITHLSKLKKLEIIAPYWAEDLYEAEEIVHILNNCKMLKELSLPNLEGSFHELSTTTVSSLETLKITMDNSFGTYEALVRNSQLQSLEIDFEGDDSFNVTELEEFISSANSLSHLCLVTHSEKVELSLPDALYKMKTLELIMKGNWGATQFKSLETSSLKHLIFRVGWDAAAGRFQTFLDYFSQLQTSSLESVSLYRGKFFVDRRYPTKQDPTPDLEALGEELKRLNIRFLSYEVVAEEKEL